ncbi:MAG: PIG-L family deacetylase [Cyclobacteriaceae bacterium]|nr:PIG-L family deacetylase [Cyclobacteriaceae bacterium]
MRTFFLWIVLCLIAFAGYAQHQPSAAEIKLKLKKLNVLGSVLYVAAHPDDENTRAIAYLANDKLATTAYLSMTRGDGGQNLIGPEIRDLLGLIRTQELLAARRIDGGEQYFTRANDFGFSKNYQETLKIWNKEEILSDVVRVIREFKPDVILTRFPPDERAGHGHHTSSAILAQEAFDICNDASVFPDQVKEFGTWKVSALYTNTGRWWNTTINENTPGIVSMNVGTYNTLLGKSYSEIAAESRTQHKSQGFGSPGRRGDALEFFEFVKGDRAQKDIMENINTSWTRVNGGEKIQPLVEKAIKEYNEENPSASVPLLLQIRTQIAALENSVWRSRKLKETEQLIKDCLGLYADAVANFYWASPGQMVTINFELINRSGIEVSFQQLSSADLNYDSTFSLPLKSNQLITFKTNRLIRNDKPYSSPYWLKEKHTQGLFTVNDKSLIGKPENDPAIVIRAKINVQGEELRLSIPLIYKWTDPVKGELSRPFEVVPDLFINFTQPVYLFGDNAPRSVSVLVKSATRKSRKGELTLALPAGWRAEPAMHPFEMKAQGEEQTFQFMVYPGSQEFDGYINAIASSQGQQFSNSLLTIQYDHIPTQTLLPPSQAKAVRVNLKKEGSSIGYIRGAGDEIPGSLRNLGYEVWEMKNEEVTASNLKRVDAVVLGVRALNTNERIRFLMPELLNYVKSGGTLIVQYNTNGDLEIDRDKFSPFPLTLSRDRVTEEDSEVKILKPEHPVLNFPNKITAKDFEGWVQERGLYFPSTWDAQYDALLSMHDTGEPDRNGSLLIAKYGEGHYVYTGLSFFRELPEGVIGAYKLFANLVSLSKVKGPVPTKVKTKKR